VLLVAAEGVLRDRKVAGNRLELLPAKQLLVHAVAPVVGADTARAGHSELPARLNRATGPR
jgi:hypothetical protein